MGFLPVAPRTVLTDLLPIFTGEFVSSLTRGVWKVKP